MSIVRSKKTSQPLDRVYLGKLTKPHALKGELKFQPFGCDAWMLEGLGMVQAEGVSVALEVEYVRGTQKNPIVKFVGVESREGSEQLSGSRLWVREEDLPALEEDYVYETQLMQCRVLNEEGASLGTVVDIMETGTFDVLVIQDEQKQEWLIPANHEVVINIRPAEKEIVVRPPEGLFESQTKETGSVEKEKNR
jgi:16S rRNA processing protein RimM